MLDVSLRLDLLRLLARLRDERGVAMLFITHDLASARYLADRVIVMQHGQVVEIGETEALVRGAEHPYTRELVEAAGEGWSRAQGPT
jgi:peptide/nickel transport system ATP-binding protein